jgi:hypothetical protein
MGQVLSDAARSVCDVSAERWRAQVAQAKMLRLTSINADTASLTLGNAPITLITPLDGDLYCAAEEFAIVSSLRERMGMQKARATRVHIACACADRSVLSLARLRAGDARHAGAAGSAVRAPGRGGVRHPTA